MALNSPLGIIAGGGDIPGMLVEECHAKGRDVFVLALKGQAEIDRLPQSPNAWIRFGQAGKGLRLLHEAGVKDLIVIGGVRRPTLMELRPDLRTAAFMLKIGRRFFGNDSLLSAVARELERDGFRIVPPQELLVDMLSGERLYSKAAPDDAALSDITLGIEAAREIGRRDIGQAAIVKQGRILGLEDDQGTDELIRRCAMAGREEASGGVLVKVCKPGQERRIDLPAIGLATVEAAAEAGLGGIAVEAGGALIVDVEAVSRAADRLGIFVIGVAVSGS